MCTYPESVAEADRGQRDMRLKEVSEVEDLVLLAIIHLPEVHRLLICRHEKTKVRGDAALAYLLF